MKHGPLKKLIDAARKARTAATPAEPETAPFGFATRVVARARETAPRQPAGTLDRIEQIGWRFAAGAAGVCVLTFALHLRQPAPNPFDALMEEEVETVP